MNTWDKMMPELVLIMCTTAFNYCDDKQRGMDMYNCAENAVSLCNNAEKTLELYIAVQAEKKL